MSDSDDMLIEPYGGKLVDLLVYGQEREELIAMANRLPSIQVSQRSLCDLELLATGAFSPLDRFMGKADYQRVLTEMRLSNGCLFPIPITLTISKEELPTREEWIALRDSRNYLLGVMRLEEFYRWDPGMESRLVLGTKDYRHHLVSEMVRWGDFCVSGELKIVNLPVYHDFRDIRHTPAEVRALLTAMGNEHVVAFQTRNPMHRIHEEITKRAVAEVKGSLLIQPIVGMTKPGDVDHYTRVRIYRALYESYYDPENTILSLSPLAMRLAGPREAVWHAIIRRNYGADHFIVGRDHAGSGLDSTGEPFYGPYEAQEFMSMYSEEVGVTVVPFKEMVYLVDEERYEEKDKVPSGTRIQSVSSTQARDDYLSKGKRLPEWFTRSETSAILREIYPPLHRQGFCIWFTGLSGSGKSTTAEVLTAQLLERGRHLTLLDGDVVRTHLSKGLGFGREERDTNVLRIGFVAGEISRQGGAVICAAISPYQNSRNECRQMIGPDHFIEVFVDTPLAECEKRDIKGLYARAREGDIKGFTGIDDPYETPENPELVLDTIEASSEDNARRIIEYLEERGFLLPEESNHNDPDPVLGQTVVEESQSH